MVWGQRKPKNGIGTGREREKPKRGNAVLMQDGVVWKLLGGRVLGESAELRNRATL